MRLVNPELYATKETRILDIARHLFAEKGYEGTGVQDIASALGLTKAALYHYYPGKEQILRAILKNRAAERDQLVEKSLCAPDMRQALEQLAVGFFEMMHRPGGRDILLILVSEGVKKTEVGDLFHGLVNGYIKEFSSGVVRRGFIRPDVEETCRAVLYAFLGGLVHYVLDHTYHGQPEVKLSWKGYGRLLSSVIASGLEDVDQGKFDPVAFS